MKRIAVIATLILAVPALAVPAAAQEAEPVTPASIVAAAAPGEWVAIAPDDLLVMELAPDAAGRARRVVIQLMPPPFSQPWVDNIRTLARAHWWDGTSVYRVVDNFVAQWGGGEDDDAGFAERALPEGVVAPVAGFEATAGIEGALISTMFDLRANDEEWGLDDSGNPIEPQTKYWPSCDTEATIDEDHRGQPINCRVVFDGFELFSSQYARLEFFSDGWPFAANYAQRWPIHCYAHVGVARDLAPDTGTGAELYAVIGHAPRALDRNIAVIGRVIEGIEHLSTLPRGTGDAGVYATRAEDTPIVSVRLASELPEPPAFEYLSTDSDSFALYVASRANRQDAFYTVPAGGVDICNVQVPIRRRAG